VVGSLNMDLVVRAARFPMPGETLLGGTFAEHPGGKGANQAVAAARLGAVVGMIGCVGDAYGDALIAALAGDEVDVTGVERAADLASGVGIITVTAAGENAIVVASGANERVSVDQVDRHAEAIREADVLVLQLEIPAEANARAADIARAAGVPVLLNAAPARTVDRGLLEAAHALVVNRVEAEMLAGAGRDAEDERLLERLRELGADEVVITLGRHGAVASHGGAVARQEAFAIDPVDTTACGDAFVGAYAVGLAEGMEPVTRLRFACAAGALAATVEGAHPSMPTRDALGGLVRPSGGLGGLGGN